MRPRTPRSEFPLETVGKIAAQLLKGENYEEAAKRALKVLDACQTELRRASEEEQALAASPYREQGLAFERNLSKEKEKRRNEPTLFAPGLRELTGKDNETDATACFREFMTAKLGSKDRANKDIQKRRKDGFTQGEVNDLRAEYLVTYPRRRPKPRRNKLRKKSLTSKMESHSPE